MNWDGRFFSQFYENVTPTVTPTAGKCNIKLSVLRLFLRDDLGTDTFRIMLADKLCLPFSPLFPKYLTPLII